MDRKLEPGIAKNFKYDFKSGVVVSLVALPLCLGIAIGSKTDPITGLLAGIVGGIVVGLISKSPIGVSGPEAGLIAIVVPLVDKIGPQNLLIVVVMAGVFQVAFGYLRAGVIVNYFPSTVIKGMLAAIGILLILKQIPHALGDDSDHMGDVALTQDDGKNTFTELFSAFQHPNSSAVIISIVSLTILILWQTKYIKKNKILSQLPAPLLVVAIGILINQIYIYYFPELSLAKHHLVSISHNTPSEFFSGMTHPDFSVLGNFSSADTQPKYEEFATYFEKLKFYILSALSLAVVASLETLLSVEATDKLDKYKRITPPNRELIAQGTGNIVSGLIGGLPITQAIVRSSVNIENGGRTPMATLIHGIILFSAVLFIPNLLRMIPMASMASILLMIGYKLANVNLFKSMFKLGMRQFLPFIITILSILITDLLIGIIIGLIVSIFFILQNHRQKEPWDVKVNRTPKDPKHKYEVTLRLHEEITYLSKNILILSLHDVPENSKLIIDGSEATFLSNDVLDEISEFTLRFKKEKNVDVELVLREMGQHNIDDSILDNVKVSH